VIKVVRIIARMNVGGPARHVLLLSQGLRAFGFETVVLTGDLDEGEVELDPAEHEGVRIVRIPGLGRPVSPAQDARALGHLVAAIRREQPAIVHTHTAKAGALGRVAALAAGVPIVVHTFHGHVLSHYFNYPSSFLVRWAERALTRITQRVITLSAGLRRELAERFAVAPLDQISVIPLGRDLTPFRAATTGLLRAELGLGDDAFLVGAVGRLVPIKRFPLMVRAFARLAADDPRAHLAIVGDGIEREAVEREVAAGGLEDRVHLLGWRSDLPAIYADLDLLALSSRNEGTPLAIIEAFAASCPVVATGVGGVADMFSPRAANGVSPPAGVSLRAEGALVAAEDELGLAAAMKLLHDEPGLRREAQQAALTASRGYDARRLLSDVATLYRELLRESRRGARLLAEEPLTLDAV
jgi:glycosyltransferase involved in cell wall biosynthesis